MSSIFSSSQSSPAQRVPAWKRLGLKLKSPASSAESGSPASLAAPVPNGNQNRDINAAKRKRFETTTTDSAVKKARKDSQNTPTLQRRKSVTFAEDTKVPSAVEKVAANPKPPAKKQAKAPKKQQSSTPDLTPTLDYLRHWHKSKDTWKFNKNHQTVLIKHAFEQESIPSADIDIFYAYIRDLKGYVRTRLRESAQEIRQKDMELGKGGFSEKPVDAESKQANYEEAISRFLQSGGTGHKRKHFNEVEFVTTSSDAVLAKRLVKRMRAEMVVDGLSDSGESDPTASTASGAGTANQDAMDTEDGDKRVKLNDGTKQGVKRRRKMRTGDFDESSSSEGDGAESDSSSSSSSSSEDSDVDGDAKMEMNPGANEVETSSSSSSSSSEDESEDESEDDDDDEDEDDDDDDDDEEEEEDDDDDGEDEDEDEDEGLASAAAPSTA
jgi:hypothetical protein